MAAPECEREARKRRERRDSGCSHERKERRPHSEERLPPPPPPPPPPLHDHNRLESERRAERLSRARRPQFGGKRRRPQARIQKQPKENDCHSTTEEIRCISPLNFDYTIIHKPEVSEDPETLDAEALQRHSEVEDAAEQARQHERTITVIHSRREQPGRDTKLDKIIKKISSFKKSIAKLESEFETQNGYTMTQGDRITDVPLTRMYENLRKLQTEKRCIKTDPVEYAIKLQAAKLQQERDEKLDAALKSEKHMKDVVKDIEEWLESCRKASGRSSVPETTWSSSQLAAEKFCVQRALLRMEAARGRPAAHSADRHAARHLYERYRTVKRALAASRPDGVIGTNGELATIHEHEPMLFNTSVDSSSDSQEKPSDSTPTEVTPQCYESEEIPSSTSSARSGNTSDETVTTNEGLHYLGLDDLNKALSEAKLQKCVLRRSIKEYEVNFELKNSRKAQKADKKGREDEYLRYKSVKAKIKLINALINKQKVLMAQTEK